MTDSEKLKKLIEETDGLIKKDITSADPEFAAWEMKVKRFISKKYGEESLEMKSFCNTIFSLPLFIMDKSDEEINRDSINACHHVLNSTKAILETYLEELQDEENTNQSFSPGSPRDLSKIFIVHGHDGELKESVARVLEKQNIDPVILSEQTNNGLTIIEKFEKNSEVGGAICLFTADDIGRAKSEAEPNPRARQNVLFETGFFMGKLGRDRVVILADSEVEIPSDLLGVVYTNTNSWKFELLQELNSMGYNIDFNKLKTGCSG